MKDEITKQCLISIFTQLCNSSDSFNIQQRKSAVAVQYQRNVWELDSYNVGKIRIERNDITAKITLFEALTSSVSKGHKNSEAYIFEISLNEYEELKKIYWADFKEDTAYLNRIYSLLKDK